LGTDDIGYYVGEHTGFDLWYDAWMQSADHDKLNSINPAIIPRNHIVEAMIAEAVAGDMQLFHALNDTLKTPFVTPQNPDFSRAPADNELVHQTFCGT